jgi:cellulose 1,4-beta-cellobiosidase
VNLLSLTNTPPDSEFTAQVITNTTAFRYVRYLSPNNGFGNVAEVQFFSPAAGGAPLIPSAPASLSAGSGDKQIQLSWTASSGATNYNIKRALVSGGPYTNIATCTAVICMDSGLAPGTYYYVVSASNSAGESPNSPEANATVSCPVLVAPTALAAAVEPGELLPAWSAVIGATGYNLLRANNSAGPYTLLAAGLAAPGYADFTVASGATYYYAVQTLNSCGASTNSAALSVTALPLPQLGVAAHPGQLLLSWPGWAGGYQPQSASNLAPPVLWQPVSSPPQNSNGTLYLSLPTTNAQQFFRLTTP